MSISNSTLSSSNCSTGSAIRRSSMEGLLSKWTNVVHGWQYRWFVLSDEALCYYTTREKMLRRQQRGCIRLRGAIIGIDPENTSLFTITVDGKTFHMQGHDEEERDKWVRALEAVIHRCSGYYRPCAQPYSMDTLKAKIIETDKHLKLMIAEIGDLQSVANVSEGETKRSLNEFITSANVLLETVKEAMNLLQTTRNQVESSASFSDSMQTTTTSTTNITSTTTTTSTSNDDDGIDIDIDDACLKPSNKIEMLAPISYSSSSEDEFFDAESPLDMFNADPHRRPHRKDTANAIILNDQQQQQRQQQQTPNNRRRCIDDADDDDGDGDDDDDDDDCDGHADDADATVSCNSNSNSNSNCNNEIRKSTKQRTFSAENTTTTTSYGDGDDADDANEDFDAIYEDTEESDVGNVQQQHGSVLMHLLSQVSVGMDLTKVTLPTFILERRSLLEMYADFFAHPDSFIVATQINSAEERFIAVVKYYLGAFYAARKSGVAKKPYNPILGETFRCRWDVPELPHSGEKTARGPFPGSDINQLTFIAEQVSHHPPISAFYAELPSKKITLNAHIWTKSSFLGLSIGVANVGWASVKLHEFDEEYTVTFPSGYGRSIMSTPWVELGGKVSVNCPKTGYCADIEFLTKPFFGGKPHRINANIYRAGFKKSILTIKGEWNGVMIAKPLVGDEFTLIDVKAKKESKKECVPVMEQSERESRRLWRHVTVGLKRNRINIATSAKRDIEQRQRDEARQRQEQGIIYQPKLFVRKGDDWIYKDGLIV